MAVLGGACQNPAEEEAEAAELGVSSAGLWSQPGVQLWTAGETIPVCWIAPGFDDAKVIIRATIKSQWQRVTRIQFDGFQDCPTTGNQQFIRVLLNAATDTQGGGQATEGRAALQLPTGNRSVHIAVPPNIEPGVGLGRLQYLAAHEFGHVLGFAHEQSRVDNSDIEDINCNPPGSASGTLWSRYDNQSVMHQCNDGGNQSGRLSVLDVRSVQKLYGIRTNGGSDFNGDGFADLIVRIGQTGYTAIQYGRASTGLDSPSGNLANWNGNLKIIPGDYNGDGYSDVILYSPGTGNAEVRLGQSTPGLTSVVGGQLNWAATLTLVPGDFQADGFLDVLKYNAVSGQTALEYGHALPGFDTPAQANPVWNLGFKFIPGDFNGDGYSDVLLYHPSTGYSEIRYGGIAPGLNFSAGSQVNWNTGLKLVPGDYNGDGFTDVLVYEMSTGSVQTRYGQATAGLAFSAASQTTWITGFDFAPGDFDGDGFADVLLYNSTTGYSEIRYGSSALGLTFAPTSPANLSTGRQLVPGDYNGDGFTDVMIYGVTAGGGEIRYGQPTKTGLLAPAGNQVLWAGGLELISSPGYEF
ncbi:VCBS repeat-containing protein [Myxococcaceae bacterium JPH2]|nr:VCBS repeat-containing protein [Myxococcaceae bacterium JPH2]